MNDDMADQLICQVNHAATKGESDDHLKGQYLIVREAHKLASPVPTRLRHEAVWNGYSIYAERSLQINTAASSEVDVVLVGFIVHHEHCTLSNQELLSWVVSGSKDREDVMNHLQDCGGRYIALIRDKVKTVAITDACAMRQLYWLVDGTQLVISSSVKLILETLDLNPEIDEKILRLLADPVYKRREYAWYGTTWYDSRINKIIANHYLDMTTSAVSRINYSYNGLYAYDDIVTYAADILKGLVQAIHARYQVIQPITAGFDSRLLLAASKNVSNKTKYYIFDNNYSLNNFADVRVAAGLCKNLGIALQVIMPANLKGEFLEVYQKKDTFPRITSSTPHIQWHYDTHRNSQVVNLNGNCAEIARYFYQNKVGRGDDLTSLIEIAGFNRIFESQINSWYAEAIEYCRDNNINVYDLFYWEQRLSNWGALYPFEQDIALEQFTPYNHKNLLLSLLHVDISRRKGPHYFLFRDLINLLWPETLSMPFNPIVGLQLKRRIKSVIKKALGKK